MSGNAIFYFFKRVIRYISRFIFLMFKNKLKIIHMKNFSLYVSIDEVVGQELYLFNSFEDNETNFFRKNINSTDICFDIGGNVGYFTMLFAALADQGHVHVFEPIQRNSDLITKSAIMNGFKNITINCIALGDFEGDIEFSVSKDTAFSSIYDTNRVPVAAKLIVPITTIDDYIIKENLNKIDVLKIDVEGAEEMVLNGGKGLLANPLTRPRIVLIELYDRNLQFFSSSVSRVVHLMASLGYNRHVFSEVSGELFQIDHAKISNKYNFIFLLN